MLDRRLNFYRRVTKKRKRIVERADGEMDLLIAAEVKRLN